MTNQNFKEQLEGLMQTDSSLRPFVCDGFPMECKIFIVGINPATKMETSFGDYYGETGFNKSKWLKDYNKSSRLFLSIPAASGGVLRQKICCANRREPKNSCAASGGELTQRTIKQK
jgi:hypothetical protein